MNDFVISSHAVVWSGFTLAVVFGFVASKSNFCTMGAISDVVNMSHWGRMRMWLLAIAVAILGTSWLTWSGDIDIAKSIYQRPVLAWVSSIVGGLLFGVGMTLAGGCANKNLIRIGGGSLRSLVVVAFVAISGYMSLKGLFGLWRVTLLDPWAIDFSKWGLTSQGLPEVVAALLGSQFQTSLLGLSLLSSGSLLYFVFKDKRFRQNKLQVLSSIVLGLIIVAAWYITGHIGLGENPETMEMTYFDTNTHTLESFSFVAPVAYTLEILMLWTDQSMHITFGIASALGVVLGSFIWAMINRSFRWEGFASIDDLKTQLLGAVLMGFGGIAAVGCTIGQGLSGVSTLAIGSLLTLTSIVCGSVLTLRWQNRD